MGAAFLWGFVGGAALLLGAAIAYLWDMPPKVLGGIIAFGFIGIFLGPVLLALGLVLASQWTEARIAASPDQSE